MRVAITGATGNVGTSLVRALARTPGIEEIVGLARRRPGAGAPPARWETADVGTDDLVPLLRRADAVVHLAWAIQPSRDARALWRTNVEGSERVFRAAADAGVGAIVYASSIGVYSPGPKDRAVDESWPREGVPTSFYARHKAEVERRLDRLERERPDVRVVRMRPGLTFKREAASGVRRLFLGALMPSPLARPGRLRLLPDVPGVRVQAVHTDDVADAYARAVTGDVRGAFNLAAEPALDADTVARDLGARTIPVPVILARAGAALSYRLRLQPTPAGWLDMGRLVPIMDTARAGAELGWSPRHTSLEALRELLEGMAAGAGTDTPPLAPGTGGPARTREIAGRMGGGEAG